jgi:hypothetical protein
MGDFKHDSANDYPVVPAINNLDDAIPFSASL